MKITQKRMCHMLGVARKAYKIAKDLGYDEDFCKKMFVLGIVHDIGYEFSSTTAEHASVSADMLALAGMTDKDALHAVRRRRRYTEEKTVEWRILNTADMLVDAAGKEVSVTERLENIRKQYGEYSDQYLTACDISYEIGLTSMNPRPDKKMT